MANVSHDLAKFHQYIGEQLKQGKFDLSPEEALGNWRTEHPPADFEETVEAFYAKHWRTWTPVTLVFRPSSSSGIFVSPMVCRLAHEISHNGSSKPSAASDIACSSKSTATMSACCASAVLDSR